MMVREIDWRPTLDAFAPLSGEAWAMLLHGGARAAAPGFDVIAAFPVSTIEARGGAAYIDGSRAAAAPFEALRHIAAARAGAPEAAAPSPSSSSSPPAPFLSGLCGYIGYEMGAALEPSAAGPASPFALPDMAFGGYDALAIFDRAGRRAYVTARRRAAGDRLAEALGAAAAPPPPRLRLGSPTSNFSEAAYRSAVAAAIEKIRDGAIFQANLSQQLAIKAPAATDAYDIFRRLAGGDAPFAAFLQHKDGAVVSNSPERFFSLTPSLAGVRILAEPIKGTRPRSDDPARDGALAQELLADPKDRAENIMIADLTRNDLSRICRDNSIAEDEICALASFAGVHHLVSRISGVLRSGLGAVDVLEALFPCGSITGAPKIEAMRTIADIEAVGRGPYCGAIGYIDDRGFADFSVAIRTIIAEKDGRLTLPVGGGVTLRSDPEREYRETLDKAASILNVLGADRANAA